MVDSGSFSYTSQADDKHGTYYELEDDAPYKGVTVDEADGEITFHD